ncbi:hypothetical protein RHOSPDRAFT_32830 [Rhodotorula sp. JG-1b]|nr:hypothetical protein RHOSPDRAFT_32830 [Rhodotorula sp. JG-1b]
MRFHVHAASCQLSSRPLLAGLFSLALLVLVSHLGGPNPRRLAFRHDKAQATATHDLYTSSLDAEPDPEVVARLLETLVTVPDDEVGQIAICASLRNEGRFIVEWLLYRLTISTGRWCYQYRVLGVDRFYLYDSGSDDDTLEKLQPWLRAGTVKLHRFRHDQKGHYQTTALETCSRTYGPKTEWLVEADCDEFYVVTEAMTALTRSRGGGGGGDLTDVPQRPLAALLAGNWLFKSADAVVVSRLTWKNAGINELPPDASVLASQTLREYQHSITFDKNLFTKSILHTRRKETGWVIPGAHYLRNLHTPVGKAKIITANGQSVKVEPFPPNAKEDEAVGTQYSGKYPGNRVFEPIVLYHYVQRDLQDCYRKLKVAQKLRKGGWRDKAGSEGCTSYVVYEAEGSSRGIHDQNGFFGAALRDVSMAESWFGRYLPLLIVAVKEVEAPAAGDDDEAPQIEPQVVDPHPDLVAQWTAKGLNPKNGMPM